MSAGTNNQVETDEDIDYADRTMEMDMRWLIADKANPLPKTDPSADLDDPTVVLDLTATQVHNLLSNK
jgi:hypothetical protein